MSDTSTTNAAVCRICSGPLSGGMYLQRFDGAVAHLSCGMAANAAAGRFLAPVRERLSEDVAKMVDAAMAEQVAAALARLPPVAGDAESAALRERAEAAEKRALGLEAALRRLADEGLRGPDATSDELTQAYAALSDPASALAAHDAERCQRCELSTQEASQEVQIVRLREAVTAARICVGGVLGHDDVAATLDAALDAADTTEGGLGWMRAHDAETRAAVLSERCPAEYVQIGSTVPICCTRKGPHAIHTGDGVTWEPLPADVTLIREAAITACVQALYGDLTGLRTVEVPDISDAMAKIAANNKAAGRAEGLQRAVSMVLDCAVWLPDGDVRLSGADVRALQSLAQGGNACEHHAIVRQPVCQSCGERFIDADAAKALDALAAKGSEK